MIVVVLWIPILGVSVEQLMVVAVFGVLMEMITTVVWEGRGPWNRRGDGFCFADARGVDVVPSRPKGTYVSYRAANGR